MKIDKLNFLFNSRFKKYLLYALGEIILIVTGILIAMKVDNYNSTKKYEKVMDQNFIKVAAELKNNIENSKIGIEYLKSQDSIIRLIMLDSIKEIDYQTKTDYAGVSLTFMTSMIGKYDYDNLLNYNISDKQYKKELISKIRNAYGYRDFVIENETILKKFVKENSFPFFSKNIPSFDQYFYFEKQNDDVSKFLLESKEYKKLLSQYAQLNIYFLYSYQIFYDNCITAYYELSKHYHVELLDQVISTKLKNRIIGKYYSTQLNDTAKIIEIHDTLYVQNKKTKNKLFYLNDNQFFFKRNATAYPFISFKNDSVFHLHIKSHDYVFTKIK